MLCSASPLEELVRQRSTVSSVCTTSCYTRQKYQPKRGCWCYVPMLKPKVVCCKALSWWGYFDSTTPSGWPYRVKPCMWTWFLEQANSREKNVRNWTHCVQNTFLSDVFVNELSLRIWSNPGLQFECSDFRTNFPHLTLWHWKCQLQGRQHRRYWKRNLLDFQNAECKVSKYPAWRFRLYMMDHWWKFSQRFWIMCLESQSIFLTVNNKAPVS